MSFNSNPYIAFDSTPVSSYGGSEYYAPTSLGISFASNGTNYSISANPYIDQSHAIGTFGVGSASLYGVVDISCNSNCSLGGGGGIAPEMNPSFIPQVGLLLGCLFFLFGRKKESAEVGLAA